MASKKGTVELKEKNKPEPQFQPWYVSGATLRMAARSFGHPVFIDQDGLPIYDDEMYEVTPHSIRKLPF